MILSVGYRVNSMRGAQFRIWANRVLQESIQLIERSLSEEIENIEDARHIARLLTEYAKGLDILDDHETLEQKAARSRLIPTFS